jgi:hypothetical protein
MVTVREGLALARAHDQVRQAGGLRAEVLAREARLLLLRVAEPLGHVLGLAKVLDREVGHRGDPSAALPGPNGLSASSP